MGDSATRTYVTWDSVTGEVIVGVKPSTKQQALLHPKNTVFDFKRLLGRSFDSDEVQSAITQLPYAIVDRDNKPFIRVEIEGESGEFSPGEVTAIVLTKMKQFAETYLGEEIEKTVVTAWRAAGAGGTVVCFMPYRARLSTLTGSAYGRRQHSL